jgi:hypothetical protein
VKTKARSTTSSSKEKCFIVLGVKTISVRMLAISSSIGCCSPSSDDRRQRKSNENVACHFESVDGFNSLNDAPGLLFLVLLEVHKIGTSDNHGLKLGREEQILGIDWCGNVR